MAVLFTVDTLDKIPEALRSEYSPVDSADPSKGFKLNVEGLPASEDVGPLKRALDREKEEKRLALEKATKAGQDVTQIQADADARIRALTESIENLTKENVKTTKRATLESTVSAFVSKLSAEHGELLSPFVAKRIRVDVEDGVTTVRVLNKDGKLSTATLDDLEAEFRADKTFAPVITASRASGSGARRENNSTGGAGGSGEQVNLNSLTPKQLAERVRNARQARGLER